MKTLNEQPLMPRDWLLRRMSRLVSKGGGGFRPSLTLHDIARWLDVEYKDVMHIQQGCKTITDRWQVLLSQFFYLFDTGQIELVVDMKARQKSWRRVRDPAPPCKVPMPRIDFAAGNKVKWD